MAISDLITQLETERGEHRSAADSLTAALDAAKRAQDVLLTAQSTEGKERSDVRTVLTQIRDEIQREIDGLDNPPA